MNPSIRMTGNRMVIVPTYGGKRYIPVLWGRWLHRGYRRKTDAEKYRAEVRRRFERMQSSTPAWAAGT